MSGASLGIYDLESYKKANSITHKEQASEQCYFDDFCISTCILVLSSLFSVLGL